MGILGRLFSQETKVEKRLRAIYEPTMTQVFGSASEARQWVSTSLRESKTEGEVEGTASYPPNTGDLLLQGVVVDSRLAGSVAAAREDGATDEDIRWWWNLHDLERRMIQKEDNYYRFASFVSARMEGKDPEAAGNEVRKAFMMYGDPRDQRNAAGDDRPLPYELKKRVNSYLERTAQSTPPEVYRARLARSSSHNAIIREEIRQGHI